MADENQTYDLAVVGAGVAGLNALAVASQYLTKDQRVLIVDRRSRVGGMWVDTYQYVRLHQPHQLFTAADIKWTLDADRAYLATKGEVLDHFSHCVDVVKGRVGLDEWLGTELLSHEAGKESIRLSCRSADGTPRIAQTKRLIKAPGLSVEPNQPLAVSSERVHSVSPDFCDVRTGEITESSAPVWVIGGGKTAMDTAHALIKACPGREVNVLAGSGTFFACRDKLFPTGVKRWWGGTRGIPTFLEWSRRFDGTNERDAMDWYRGTVGITPTDGARNFVFGLLSEAEARAIRSGVTEMVNDHLVDAVDRGGGVELLLRSGATRQIEPGSWLINCTGYVFGEQPQHPYEPYVSADGNVGVISTRTAITLLPSFGGYYLSHLMMLGQLGELPLYELDGDQLARQSREAWACAAVTMNLYNLSVIADNAPREVLRKNGLNLDLWYPLHRYIYGGVQFARAARREREHWRLALDRVAERFDVRCGPIVGNGHWPS
ncbi:MAG TPA: FAD-dependent oxidoreductase [Solirubrobacterales bacterium]|nr:FAD-dependent oxidoreductase [Solirubrobacterales bacterium]